jgi:hypothetical protein
MIIGHYPVPGSTVLANAARSNEFSNAPLDLRNLLAEYHAVTQLAGDPELARGVIEAALRADLAAAAAEVAVQTQARVGVLLAGALASAPAAVHDLIRIKEALPYPSVVLTAADLAVTMRIRRELPPGTSKQDAAR